MSFPDLLTPTSGGSKDIIAGHGRAGHQERGSGHPAGRHVAGNGAAPLSLGSRKRRSILPTRPASWKTMAGPDTAAGKL
jgi:hypothetical protein